MESLHRLLWPKLQDTNIFHRTKICELILEAFNKYFGALKCDLAVSAQLSRVTQNLTSFREHLARSHLHLTSGQILSSVHLWQSLHTGLPERNIH
jgi:hypothetical protein